MIFAINIPKLLFLSFIPFILLLPASGQGTEKERPKVGVVLSGGGAKGFAHIGALKVLEEAGIPVDYIAGTSIGAIVGALYAIGYDSHAIDSLVKGQDWTHLLSDETYREYLPAALKENPGGFIVSLPYKVRIKERSGQVQLPPGVVSGQNLYSLFLNLTIGYQHPIDFNDLPIPFACVAADSRSRKEIVFRKGVLPEAIRASMAIPGFFAPVEKDSMLLVDGGIINNYPVDVVREMGADIVIGVITSRDRRSTKEHQGTLTEVIEQLGNFVGQEKRAKNIADTDILITPDTKPYEMLDFQSEAIDTIIARGEAAAREKWDTLMELKQQQIVIDSMESAKKIQNPYIRMDTLEIKSLRFEGISQKEKADLIKRINIIDNRITRRQLQAITSRIYGSGSFSRVYYQLDGESPFDLVFNVEPKTHNTLDLGVRFDTKDMASILAHTSVRFNSSLNSVFDLTIRLSRNPYLKVDYSINRGIFYRGGVSARIGRNDVDIRKRGDFAYKLDFIRSGFDLNFSEFYLYNIRLHLGAGIDNFHFMTKPSEENGAINNGLHLPNRNYVNYFLSGAYDNLNRSYLPTTGQYFNFQYTLYTDNFYQMHGKAPLNVLDMNFFKPLKISDRVYITPEISGRVLFNATDSIPLLYGNFVGGQYKGQYVPQQIAVQGSNGMELMKNTVAVASLNIRYHLTSRQLLFTNLNTVLHHDDPLRLLRGKYFFGGSIGYSYNTILGPLTLELGYSSLSTTIYPFASIGYYF